MVQRSGTNDEGGRGTGTDVKRACLGEVLSWFGERVVLNKTPPLWVIRPS